jgi:hypothetical protein
MNGLVHGDFLVKPIRVLYRAVFDTGGAACAFVFYDISRTGFKGDGKVPLFTFYRVYFRECQNLNVGMPADLDQFRRENSHRAVICREGLVELGHVPADAGTFFHEIHLEPGCGKIKGGLDTADASAHNQDVAKILVTKAGCKLLYDFCRQYFVFHFLFSSSYIFRAYPYRPAGMAR